MPATVQLNTRIDPDLKRRGDAVFARAGLTSSEVVRAVWQSAAETQQVPELVTNHAPDDEARARRLKAIEEGANPVRAFAADRGLELSFDPTNYKRCRDELYDDMAAELMGASHA